MTGRNPNEIPDSIVVGTVGPYTIPTDRYAVVTAQVDRGGTFLINASTALSSFSTDTTWNNLGGSNLKMGANSNLKVVTTDPANAADALSVSTAHDLSQSSDVAQYKLPQGTIISGVGNCRYVVELYKMPGT